MPKNESENVKRPMASFDEPDTFDEMLESFHARDAWRLLERSPLTELLFELQHEQDGNGTPPNSHGSRSKWVKLDRRLWLKQQRRSIDLSSLQHQDEVWTFEIDWRFVKKLTDYRNIKLNDSAEFGADKRRCLRIPFPVLGVRRFVATDYSCVDDEGNEIPMTHRRTNDAFASLMMTYYLLHKLPRSISNTCSREGFFERTFKLWKDVLDLGGNFSHDEQIRRQRIQEICRLELINDLSDMVPKHDILEDWFPDGTDRNLVDAFDEWRQTCRRMLASRNEYMHEFLNELAPLRFRRHHRKWVRGWLPSACDADRSMVLETIRAIAGCDAISKYYTEHYPVMICVPVPDNPEGCTSYKVHVHRHGDSDLHLCEELDRLEYTREARVKMKASQDDGEPNLRSRFRSRTAQALKDLGDWSRTMLRFKRFAHVHAVLRDSAFLVAKLPKDIRTVRLRDHNSDGVSIASGEGIYSSLHGLDYNPAYPRITTRSAITTQCWLIPRFRCVAPFFVFLPIQIALLMMYLHMTNGLQQPGGFPPQQSGDDPSSLNAFLAIVAVQIGVTVFIGTTGESGVLTRVMRWPRFCAMMMVPLNLWMTCNVTIYRPPVQIILGWRCGNDGRGGRPSYCTVDLKPLSNMGQSWYLLQELLCLITILVLAQVYYRSYLGKSFRPSQKKTCAFWTLRVIVFFLAFATLCWFFFCESGVLQYLTPPNLSPSRYPMAAIAAIPGICLAAIITTFGVWLFDFIRRTRKGRKLLSVERRAIRPPFSMGFLMVPCLALFLFGSYHGSYGLTMPFLTSVVLLVGLCLWLACYIAMRFGKDEPDRPIRKSKSKEDEPVYRSARKD